MNPTSRTRVLLIGGRSGVGKTTAAAALHDLLATRDIPHALIEGDNLDLAHPAPHVAFPDARLAQRNLTTVWRRYRELGFTRLIYTNTSAVVTAPELIGAIGGEVEATIVLLRSSDDTAERRLRTRALGTPSPHDVQHSADTATRLDAAAADVHRVDTDGMTPREVAEVLLDRSGWAGT